MKHRHLGAARPARSAATFVPLFCSSEHQRRADLAAWGTYRWGAAGDVPVRGDFDGDGTTDLAMYRPSTGIWYVLTSSSGFTEGRGYAWGAPGDVPVPGDFDGDGRADVAVYRPGDGHWFVLLSSTNYSTWASFQWGTPGDQPVSR